MRIRICFEIRASKLGFLAQQTGDVVGSAQRFGYPESLATFKDELNACRQINSVTRRDKERLYIIFCPENNSHLFSFSPNQLIASL